MQSNNLHAQTKTCRDATHRRVQNPVITADVRFTKSTKGRFGVLLCYRNHWVLICVFLLVPNQREGPRGNEQKIARWTIFAKFLRTAQGVERTAVSYTTMRRRWAYAGRAVPAPIIVISLAESGGCPTRTVRSDRSKSHNR